MCLNEGARLRLQVFDHGALLADDQTYGRGRNPNLVELLARPDFFVADVVLGRLRVTTLVHPTTSLESTRRGPLHTAAPGRRLATLLLHQLIRLHRLDLLLHQHVLLLLNLAHYRWWQVLARSSGRLLRLRFHQLALLLSSCLVVLVVIIVAVLIVASPRRRSPVRLRRWRLPVLLRRPTRRRPTRRRPTRRRPARWTAAWRW
eukprot:COSAG03_NODE_2202_length_3015_cov_1.789781_1_plen_202_part_10